MNVNTIINMIIRQITRRLVNGGINKGMDMASKGMSKRRGPDARQVEDANRRDPRG